MPYEFRHGVPRNYPRWVSPFGHRRLNGWLAPPRRFSQPPTSFFASEHLGIHHTPLVAYLTLVSYAPKSPPDGLKLLEKEVRPQPLFAA
jgi:hypothetical protein